MVDKFEVDMKQYIENEENFRKFTSLTNSKISIDDFSILTVIGKGSYGKVLLVKKNDDQKIYAMKVLKKKSMIRRNQTEHIKTERRVLVNLPINQGNHRSSIYNQAEICFSNPTETIFSNGLLSRR
jgi:serine/threonine protein kinase